MKKLVILFFSFVIIPLHGQTSDAFSISAEECFLLGDYNSSFNILSLSNAANNSGIRIGYYKNHNERFSTSVSLGVTGTSNRQNFSMKSVPVEILEHISLGTLSGFSIGDLPLLWQFDAGLSSALTTSTSASFNRNRNASFSESLILGLSLQLVNTEREELYIGYRHNFFIDDWLDGLVEGNGNDHLMRFQTTYRIKLGNDSKWKKAFEELSAEHIEMKKFISQNQLVPRTSQVKDSAELNIEQTQHLGDSLLPTSSIDLERTAEENSNSTETASKIAEEITETKMVDESATIIKSSIDNQVAAATPTDKKMNGSDDLDSANVLAENPKDTTTDIALTVENEEPYAKIPLKEKEFAIVIGSFKSEDEAISYAKRFRYGKARIVYFEGLNIYRVIAGVYSNSMEIEYRLEELKYYGYKPWITKY